MVAMMVSRRRAGLRQRPELVHRRSLGALTQPRSPKSHMHVLINPDDQRMFLIADILYCISNRFFIM